MEKSKVEIIPAILAYSEEDLKDKLGRVEGLVSRAQIDIVGRVFSPDVSVGIETLERLSDGLVLDVQLMVREPVSFLNRCDWGGVDRVFGHVEYMKDQQKFIEHAFALGMQVGLAVDLETPVSKIEKALSQLDAILLMAVAAGKSGQEFDKRVLKKIQQVRAIDSKISICVDGGVNTSNIRLCVDAGANEFAVGSFLWESKDVGERIKALKEAVE